MITAPIIQCHLEKAESELLSRLALHDSLLEAPLGLPCTPGGGGRSTGR